MMSQKMFQSACEALWGPVCQSQAARDLGISLSSCVRYDTGQRPVPALILDRLGKLLVERKRRIDQVLATLAVSS
jgi:hypothetical protein